MSSSGTAPRSFCRRSSRPTPAVCTAGVRYDRGVRESFVDLTYRGLSLGRRIRLTQIRPSSGYLELPAPMPVGSQIAVIADDGAVFDAIVTGIHEQISGSERVAGMTVSPALGDAAAAAWWTSRVQLPDD